MKKIHYEWDIETIDPESGDILDHHHADKLEELHHFLIDPGMNIEYHLVLVRDVWDTELEDLVGRSWWYPDHDENSIFSCGLKVPQSRSKEWNKTKEAGGYLK